MISVDIQHVSQHKPLPSDEMLTTWVCAALREHTQNAMLTIRLVDSDEMIQLNTYYRGKNKVTNVLSFPMSGEEHFLGDIAICAPVVAQEAQDQNKPWEAHWAHLVIHGCLHLLGFDHITETQAAEMEPLEVQILAELGYSNPY